MIAVVTALHVLSVALIAGAMTFTLVAMPGGHIRVQQFGRALNRLFAWSLAAAAVSAVAWLWLAAAEMGGSGIADASTAIPAVVADTHFGNLWIARMALLAVLVFSLPRPGEQASPRGVFAALALLISIAATGHAAGSWTAMAIQAAHLAAAGVWFGGLAALWLFLSGGDDRAAGSAGRVTKRFGTCALLAVAVLSAAGAAAAISRLTSFAALTATPYGELLIAKTVFFAVALAFAALNRWRFVPKLEGAPEPEKRKAIAVLVRSVGIEVLAVASILMLAGWLAQTPPPHMAVTL